MSKDAKLWLELGGLIAGIAVGEKIIKTIKEHKDRRPKIETVIISDRDEPAETVTVSELIALNIVLVAILINII